MRVPNGLYKSLGAMIVQDGVMSKILFPSSLSRGWVQAIPRFLLILEACFIKKKLFEQYLELIRDSLVEKKIVDNLVRETNI